MRLLASSLALGVACFYLWLIGREGEGVAGRVWLVYGCLVAAAVLLLVRRTLADVVASTLLLGWAALGVFSIGLLLVPPAVLGCASALRLGALAPGRARALTAGAAAVTVTALAVGLRLT